MEPYTLFTSSVDLFSEDGFMIVVGRKKEEEQ
jgi:hypothetical protein